MNHAIQGAETDAEYRSLELQHRDFEVRLAELARKPRLSAEERIEETNIKKFKLKLKDRMAGLRRASRAIGR